MPSLPPRHTPAQHKTYDQERGSAHQRGYTYRWQQARIDHLRQHPLCAHCLLDGVTALATVVDHIVPHRGDLNLFWQKDNWQSLCARHHQIKTAQGL